MKTFAFNIDMIGEGEVGDEELDSKPLIKKYVIPRFMIKGSGSFRSKWDFLIIFLAIYNSFSIPLKLAFNPYVLNINGFLAADAIVDLVFLFDIILTFRTSYLDPKSGD